MSWKPVEEFQATMTYLTFHRGRSSAILKFGTSDGRTFPMFLTEFDKAAKYMVRGVLTGTFIVTKRGQNYGIKLVIK